MPLEIRAEIYVVLVVVTVRDGERLDDPFVDRGLAVVAGYELELHKSGAHSSEHDGARRLRQLGWHPRLDLCVFDLAAAGLGLRLDANQVFRRLPQVLEREYMLRGVKNNLGFGIYSCLFQMAS